MKEDDPSDKNFPPHEEWLKEFEERLVEKVQDSFGSWDKGPYTDGYWLAIYSFDPVIDEEIDPKDFLDRLRSCVGRETGWPVGLYPEHEGQPYPYKNNIEAWFGYLGKDPGFNDFWRASPNGKFALARGHQEDSEEWGTKKKHEGKAIDFTLPVWRICEFLLHGMRFAQEFSPEETREMRVTVIWKGIKDRTLISTNQRIGPLHWERKSQQDEIRSDLVIPDALHLQDQLPEFVHKLTKPLYDAFDFFKMPESTMQNQLDEMMARVR